MDVYVSNETNDVIIFNIYYKRYGKIDTQITYIKIFSNAIRKVVSEICSVKTIFFK